MLEVSDKEKNKLEKKVGNLRGGGWWTVILDRTLTEGLAEKEVVDNIRRSFVFF